MRAFEVAAGAHNLLLIGPPGAGKTLIARAMPGILPSLTLEEALEVTRIYSVADILRPYMSRAQSHPFRLPHHLQRRAHRRRTVAPVRRDQPRPPRRPLPGRDTGVQPARAGGHARAVGGQVRHDQPCLGCADVSGQLHTDERSWEGRLCVSPHLPHLCIHNVHATAVVEEA